MNAKAAIFSFNLFLVIFLLVAETTLAKPKVRPWQVERYARNRMFLPEHEKPEAIREFVERNIPATEIDRNVCFGSKDDPDGSFEIKQAGKLLILRVDYVPTLSDGETKDLKLADENGPVTTEDTTSDNIHFDFRFFEAPLEVSVGDKFTLSEESGSGEEFCVSVWGYYAPA
ncbi:uncharacterized protein [Montipora capricornis]|uniref:uncharacterized protein n=1 Tax=Montipora capricornis TaxID=246305 RepID=UPI0035F21B31